MEHTEWIALKTLSDWYGGGDGYMTVRSVPQNINSPTIRAHICQHTTNLPLNRHPPSTYTIPPLAASPVNASRLTLPTHNKPTQPSPPFPIQTNTPHHTQTHTTMTVPFRKIPITIPSTHICQHTTTPSHPTPSTPIAIHPHLIPSHPSQPLQTMPPD